MPTEEILTVNSVHKCDGEYAVKCPHCKEWLFLAEDDLSLSEIRGEQYVHSTRGGCGGWIEIDRLARYAGRITELD